MDTAHTERIDRDRLDWNAAIAGLDLVLNGELDDSEPAFTGARVARLLERLLEQLDVRGRNAYDGEDTHLRRGIGAYAMGEDKAAVNEAFQAARIGRVPMFDGGFGAPDRSIPLREELQQAVVTREDGSTQ
jgi:hypothetical protein